MSTAGDCSLAGRARAPRLPAWANERKANENGMGMMAEAGTFRLASGIFYEPAPLGKTVGDLMASGFRRRQMCLAGTREALARVELGAPGTPRQLRPLYPLADGVEVMGTSGALLRKLLKEAAWHEGASALPCAWLLPELFGRFKDHIRADAAVLLVNAPDPRLLQSGSRILLRHSAHPVQTHEFSVARAPSS